MTTSGDIVTEYGVERLRLVDLIGIADQYSHRDVWYLVRGPRRLCKTWVAVGLDDSDDILATAFVERDSQ
jgi:hypothetical protein